MLRMNYISDKAGLGLRKIRSRQVNRAGLSTSLRRVYKTNEIQSWARFEQSKSTLTEQSWGKILPLVSKVT